MGPKKSEIIRIPINNNIEYAKKVFPKDWFIPKKWVNFENLMEEEFSVKDLFDHVSWTPFLDKFSSLHHGPYALF